MKLTDKYGRVHRYLRLSVTDKCNLNCIYCNPSISNFSELHKSDILSFDEITRIVDIFTSEFEFDKVRLTGGEPFARKGIIDLIAQLNILKQKNPFELVATTNGILINGKLKELKVAGLDRLNFSLDSLVPQTFKKITGFDKIDSVLSSVNEAVSAGFDDININVVMIRGVNDTEINSFVEFAIKYKVTVRFIEYMPFSSNGFDEKLFIASSEIKDFVESEYKLEPVGNTGTKVSRDFKIINTDGKVGFISSISNHFCDGCDRLRITSDGLLRNCLFSIDETALNLKFLLRRNHSDEEIKSLIVDSMTEKNQKHLSLELLKILNNNNMLKIGG